MAADTRHKSDRPDRPGAEHPVNRPASQQHQRRDPSSGGWERHSYSPFAIMRQGLDEMDRWVSQRGWGRSWMPSAPSAGGSASMGQQFGDWTPAIEAFQRGNEFIVRAEVPGMNRQDLQVEAGDDSLIIRGERKHEQENEREGVFWSERSYGSFTRVIPLPPGTITESAKASFTNGVLEVVMQAPSAEARRGRRIDISGAPHDKDK